MSVSRHWPSCLPLPLHLPLVPEPPVTPDPPVHDQDAAVIPVVDPVDRPRGERAVDATSQPASVIQSRYCDGISSEPTASSSTWTLTPARQRSASAWAVSAAGAPSSNTYCA